MGNYALPARRDRSIWQADELRPYFDAVYAVTDPRDRLFAMMTFYRSIPQGSSADRGYHRSALDEIREAIVDTLDDSMKTDKPTDFTVPLGDRFPPGTVVGDAIARGKLLRKASSSVAPVPISEV